MQLVEQQLAPAVQAWPTALHPGPPEIAAQVVPAQLRVQHSAPPAQVAPTSLHWVVEQLPEVHRLVQHSVDEVQLLPAGLQKLCWVQMPLALQKAEQHSLPAAQS